MYGASETREPAVAVGVTQRIPSGSKQKRVVMNEKGPLENCCPTSRSPVLRRAAACKGVCYPFFPAELRWGSLLCSPPARAAAGTGTAPQDMEIGREDRAQSGGVGRRKQSSEQLLQNKGRTNAALGRENL